MALTGKVRRVSKRQGGMVRGTLVSRGSGILKFRTNLDVKPDDDVEYAVQAEGPDVVVTRVQRRGYGGYRT